MVSGIRLDMEMAEVDTTQSSHTKHDPSPLNHDPSPW